jgi:hypothetical protein
MTKAPSSLQELRRRIYRKAKSETTHRFWGLFVHITKIETLEEAYRTAKKNGGAPGIDGQSFQDIESVGRAAFLAAVREDLVTGRYKPMPNRRVEMSEGQRQSSNASDSLYPRPCGAEGAEADPGSCLRGGLSPELLRMPTEAVTTSCPGGSQAQCDAADVHGHRC